MKPFAPMLMGGAIVALAIFAGFADVAGIAFLAIVLLALVNMPGKAFAKVLGTLFVAALAATVLQPAIDTTVVTNQVGGVPEIGELPSVLIDP